MVCEQEKGDSCIAQHPQVEWSILLTFRTQTVDSTDFLKLLRVFYAFFSTRAVQKTPTHFLCISQYQQDPKQQIDALVDRRVKRIIEQRLLTYLLIINLFCSIVRELII